MYHNFYSGAPLQRPQPSDGSSTEPQQLLYPAQSQPTYAQSPVTASATLSSPGSYGASSPGPGRPHMTSRVLSTSSSQSYQSGVIKEHWNDLPANFTPTSSRSVSRVGTPRNGYAAPEVLSPPAQGDLDFESLLAATLAAPSHLTHTEQKSLASKVNRSVTSMTPEQRNALANIFHALIEIKVESPSRARERVVEFMMQEKGVAGWAMAVRKIVENVVVG